ncbi:MAG: hypothetical protein FWF53_09530 [Candidatus Azobacteroides sp.]|nr:hypothetical protein [Candidatus Azobacteroides sp.]
MMRKYICFLLLFSFISVCIKSQSDGIQAPAIIPKSPEVTELERYGEYPVSEYTGIPGINIPLYTVKIKDFEFPISLDYHATGIQVTQEATWVGLGWNLLSGGCISISAVGAVDGSLAYASTSDWDYMLNYSKPYWQRQSMPLGVPTTFPVIDGSSFNFNGISQFDLLCMLNDNSRKEYKITREARLGGGERDIYNVSILGQSFKFSIHPTTGAYIYNGEKNKYKMEKQGDTWLLTDEFGYQYIFKNTDREMIYISGQYNSPQVSWYLSQIVYQGNILVEINYNKSALVQKLPILNESCDYLDGNKFREYRFASYTEAYHPLYISSIITPLDSIVFTTGSREDMRGALKLQEMKVMDRSSKTVQKRYEFKYDYFTGTTTGVGVSSIPDYVKKRLKLTQVVQWDNSNAKSIKYVFAYNESIALPCKTSFSQDFWGYYNGYINAYPGAFNPTNGTEFFSSNNTLLPTVNFIASGEELAPCLLNFTGADRRVNKDAITAGMLKSITYPTGGKTEFEFEPHILGNMPYPTEQSIAGGNYQIGDNGYPSFMPKSKSYQFDLERTVPRANVCVTIVGKNYDVSKMGEFYITLTVAAGSTSAKTYKYAITTEAQKEEFKKNKVVTITDQVDLPVGRVAFSTHIDPNLPNPNNYNLNNGVIGSLHFTYVKDNAIAEGTSLGGGLRIKKITNYTDNSIKASVKRYNYITKDGKPSGKLIHPMKFTDQYYTKEGLRPNRNYDLLNRINSSNVWNYSTSGCEAVVGYDRVEVENLSLDEKYSTGKRIIEFNNAAVINVYSEMDIFIPYNKTASVLNGKIASSIILNGNNDTINVEKNTYSVENMENNFINIREMKWLGDIPEFQLYSVIPVLMVYPTTNYTTYLKKKEEFAYFGTGKVNKTTEFEYDPSNYKVKKITETLDNSKKKITEYQYGVSNSALLAKNMVSVPIKETVSMNSTLIQTKTMNYNTSVNSGFGLALSNVAIKNGSNAEEIRLKYENYDNFGNPVYITKDGTNNVVYIWGYNYQRPIAEIKNITYSQLTGIISAADLNAIAKKPAPAAADMDRINNLRDNTALKDAHITTFWYQPMVGLIQIKDPAKKDVYFEYDTFNRLKSSYIIENGTKKIVEGYDYYVKQ